RSVAKAARPSDERMLSMLALLDRFNIGRLSQNPKQQWILDHPTEHLRWLVSGADGRDRVSFLIGLVPDPIQSGRPYRFDNAITAMLMAMSQAGYVIDSHDIDHWRPLGAGAHQSQEGTEEGSTAHVVGNGRLTSFDERAPGVILLRKPRPHGSHRDS